MSTPAATAVVGPGTAAAAARAPTAIRPSERLRRKTCNATPSLQLPAHWRGLASRAALISGPYSGTVPKRKSPAGAGGADLASSLGIASAREHPLEPASGGVQVDASIAAEPRALAVGLRVGEAETWSGYKLAVVLGARVRVVDEPHLS